MSRRKTRGLQTALGFEALSIEGGLISPEWLSRVAQLAADAQSDADYRIEKGCNLRDEIGRYWRIAQAHWAEFSKGRAAGGDARQLSEHFVHGILSKSLGFATLSPAQPVVVDERTYPIGHSALSGRVPVVIASADEGLDGLSSAFGDSGRRRSAFGLAQEYLNAADGALWGVASDGLTLRILRDNASLTRPAWIEVDLARLFGEERYADFTAFWLLAHETRFGGAAQPVDDCALETWRKAGREEGTRAREHLREGVEAALKDLGQGFLSQPDNQALRADLQSGALSTKDFFNQLLRLVYRLIFLITVEERGLLHPSDADEKAKALYAAGYSMRRLRDRSVKRNAHDRFGDLWEATKIVFRGLATGEPKLGLPALAGIFAADQCPGLDAIGEKATKLENRFLLLAIFRLGWLRDAAGLSRVNWRDMGPEELGSVYESLLELVPQITKAGREFDFAKGAETKGNARKTSGSYYTPDSLVQVLLDSALEPVIANTIAKNPTNTVEALLKLSIVDPACGSGHFLLGAARRLAVHVARIQANGTPSAAEYRHAMRQVVGRCIYGVDLNPMAVQLCKVSLWMEAVDPGLPLTFLNSHIQHGNALLGTTPELMERGIPDVAWEAIEGDDKKTASALKKRNKAANEGGQRGLGLFAPTDRDESALVAQAVTSLEATPDADLAALTKKESQWDGILHSPEYVHQRFIADAWCAAFVWPKQPGALADAGPANDLWRQIRDGQGTPPALTVKTVNELAEQYRFFHWQLAFPQVFVRGGFDVVLGNPPWEKVKLLEQEFFGSRCGEIATAPSASARKRLITELAKTDPRLLSEWSAASRASEGQSHFFRQSPRYPLCGRGDVNTYALFAEHNRAILRAHGRAGFVVPTGIATDDTTKGYFNALMDGNRLISLHDFQSGPGLFGSIGHGTFKFCLLTVSGSPSEHAAEFSFYSRSVETARFLSSGFSLSAKDLQTLNPNTRTCPTFRSRRDADINLAIYRRAGVLWVEGDKGENPWGIRFLSMFHMTSDSALFRTQAQLESSGAKRVGNRFEEKTENYFPLAEAKMVHHFDHRYGDYEDHPEDSENTSLPDVPLDRLSDPTYSPMPRYWVSASEVTSRLANKWTYSWLFGWRDVTKPQNERTVIPTLLPRIGVGNTTPLMLIGTAPPLSTALYACLCSFALDYAARQKVGGTHLNYVQLKQLPVLAPKICEGPSSWDPATSFRAWLFPRVLELTYTAWDLEPFAHDVGYDGPPFRWDPERRFLLRCELDAAFFHVYGLNRDDTDYVMDTFPIVRRNDEKAHGEYRTKRVILEIYDEMAEAARTGKPYKTRLDPPPADPSAAHAESTRPAWAQKADVSQPVAEAPKPQKAATKKVRKGKT